MERSKRLTTAAAMMAAFLAFLPVSLLAATSEIVLPLTVNEVARGEVPVVIAGDDIFVPVSALEQAGATGVMWQRAQTVARLRRAYRVVGGQEAISLKALAPWGTFKFDESNLTLSVVIDANLLGTNTLMLQTPRPRDLVYAADRSTFINYAASTAGFHDVSLFSEVGSSIRGNLLYTGLSRTPQDGFVRGLSNLTIDQRRSLRRWTIGDATAFSDNLGGSGIVGGVTLRSEYGIDPYFIRYPGLNLRGIATTPSNVELYINGVLVDRREVPPGPFELRNVIGTSGIANAQVVIRDAFGRVQTEGASFYYSTSVLARGLSEYVYSTGFIRNNLSRSFDYGDPVGVAFHRYGLTDAVTIGGRAETSRHLVSGGPLISMRAGFGEFDLSGAGSSSDGRTGTAGEFGFRRIARQMNFAGSVRFLSREYSNFSLRPQFDRPLRESTLSASYLTRFGNVAVQWSAANMRDSDDRERVAVLGNFSVTSRTSLLLSVGSSEQAGLRQGEYFAGFSFRAGANTTANVAYSRIGNESSIITGLQRPLPIGTGFGYRLQTTSLTGDTQGAAALQYQNGFGRYSVDFNPFHPKDPVVNVAGGLVYQEGVLAPTRPVEQSFALIRVGSIPGVRVYSSNQLIGHTDARGNLLVPNLLPYYGNRLRIDDRDVPLTYDVQTVERTIAPPFRGGALVDFNVRQVRSLIGKLVIQTPAGNKIPAYGEIQIKRDGEVFSSPIGGAGEFYFENVPAGTYSGTAEYTDGTCTFSLAVPDSRTDIIKLGQITCSRETVQP